MLSNTTARGCLCRALPLLFAAALANPAVILAQTPVFSDTFSNGVLEDSDVIPGAWPANSIPANTTATESGGKLVITAGGAGSPNGTLLPSLRSGTPTADFNFFRKQLRFAVDLELTGDVPTLTQRQARFVLCSTTGSSNSADDAIAVRVRGDNTVALSAKQNKPNANTESVAALVSDAAVGGTVTRFELTLDATYYTLTVFHTGASGSASWSGAHGLAGAQWGPRGDSAIHLEVRRNTQTDAGANQFVAGTWDNLIVTRFAPPPAIFEDTFGNGVPAHSDLIPGFWTASTPGVSAIVENGQAQHTAESPSAGNIRVVQAGPLMPALNFFDRQIRISADLTLEGDVAVGTAKRSRMTLSSIPSTPYESPNTITAAIRGLNSIALTRKLNKPNTEPDANASGVAALIGVLNANLNIGDSSNSFTRYELTLNATRFQLKGYGAGKGSSVSRFSGEHGLSREMWGSNGDSALMIETVRLNAGAGAPVVTLWDNVLAEADATSLPSDPYWDFEATYETPPPLPWPSVTANYRLWLPGGEPIIRGIIFIGAGTGGDYRYFAHDMAFQETARALGFGILGYPNEGNMILQGSAAPARAAVQTVLNRAAEVSGHPEIANAPICATGNSAGGYDAGGMAINWPERTIAFVAFRGSPNAFAFSDATKKVPGLFVAGSKDSNTSTNPYKNRDCFLNWRGQGCQVAWTVDWLVGHQIGGNQGWEAAMTWFVEVANLRWPRPLVPSTTPGVLPALIDLEDASGWLGETAEFDSANLPIATDPFTPVAPYASYAGDKLQASWLPNETCARMYQAFTSTDLVANRKDIPLQNSVRIACPEQLVDPVPAGKPVKIEADPRGFDTVNAIVSVEFYDGAKLLGVDSAGPEWSLEFTPAKGGLRTLSVVATDALGARRAAFRTLAVEDASDSAAANRRWSAY